MSSSDRDTGANGSMCECGSMSGTLDSAEFRSATRESAGIEHPRGSGPCRIYHGYVLQRPARITNRRACHDRVSRGAATPQAAEIQAACGVASPPVVAVPRIVRVGTVAALPYLV